MAVGDMLVGVTFGTAELVEFAPKLMGNELFWIGPNSDGMPPSWQDPRFLYCRQIGAVPIVGMRLDGDTTRYQAVIDHLSNLPNWFPLVYLTEHAQPEVDYDGNHTAFIQNYRDWYNNVVQQLPAVVRTKFKVGPVLSASWTDDDALGAGNWARFDPGLAYADFFGANMLVEPGPESGPVYPDAAAFMESFRGYRLSVSDDRPRIVPLLGAIGLPYDTLGIDRAEWIVDATDEFDTWNVGSTGWPMVGFTWFHGEGRSARALAGIGPMRYYQLTIRQSGFNTRDDYGDDLPQPLYALNNTIIYYSDDPSVVQPDVPNTPPHPAVPPTTIELPPGGPPVTGPAAAKLLAADYTVLVTDADLNVLGDPIYEWDTLQCSIRWKEPGSGIVTVPAHRYIRTQLVPGSRIVIIRRVLGTYHILMAGPMEKVMRERSDDGENGGVGKLTINFVEDLAWLAARLAFPNPALPIDQQTGDYWNFDGDPEAAMLQLVKTQAGPEALPQRRVPRLVVAPYSGVAGTGTVALGDTSDVAPRERLERLTDVLRKICTLGANPPGSAIYHPDSLGFRTRQTMQGDQNVILFEPIRSRDLSGEVHFSFGRGNLEFYSFELEAPSLTNAMVGGQGEGADRALREIQTTETDNLAWGRYEGYVAAPGTDALAQAEAAGRNEMADKLAAARLATNASDTVDQRYGVHYNVGDTVSVELDADEYVIAPIQTVNVQAWPTAGEVVGVTIGDQSARYDSDWIKRMVDLERRLGRQERR